MPTITSITPQKRKNVFNIFVDGEYAFSGDSFFIASKHLSTGKIYTRDQLDRLIADADFKKLLDKTLNFFSFRPRSQKETVIYLQKQKADQSQINKIIAKLTVIGVLDDQKFAQWWIEQRNTFRPKSARLIKGELFTKGIKIDNLSDFGITRSSESQKAADILKKVLPRWKNLEKPDLKKKAAQYLLSRGFNWDLVKDTIQKVIIQDISDS